MGDSIDNIPGARDPNEKPAPGERRKAGIGEVGARQLIQQFGSAEEALPRASEVKRASYREALEKYGEFVRLSKQLATIPTDAPVPLFARRAENSGAGRRGAARALRRAGLHFPAARTRSGRRPAQNRTTRRSIRPPRSEISRRRFRAAQEAASGFRSIPKIRTSKALARACSASKFRRSRERRAPSPTTPKTKRSPRSTNGSPIRSAPKIVHDPKLVHLLAAPDSSDGVNTIAGIRDADHALFLSFAAHHGQSRIPRSRAAPFESHAFGRARRARRFSAAPRARAARGSRKAGPSSSFTKRIDLPLAPVLARMEAAGVRVDTGGTRRNLRESAGGNRAARKEHLRARRIRVQDQFAAAACRSAFRQTEFAAAAPAAAPKARSTAAEVLEELALVHELPKKVLEYRELAKLKSTYADALAAADPSRHGPPAHALQPDRHGDRAAQLVESQSAEYSHAHRTGPRNPRRVRGVAGPPAAFRRLFADRAAHPGASFRGPGAGRGVSPRRGHSLAHGAGSFRRRALRANARASPRRPK